MKWRHLQKIPVARDQTIRLTHQRCLEQLVVTRILAPKFGARDQYLFRHRLELGQVSRPAFDITVELRAMEMASELIKGLIGE